MAFCNESRGFNNPFNVNQVTIMSYFSTLGYIGEFEVIDDHRGSKIVVNLNGRINKCGVISPRFDVKLKDVEKWSSYLLPSRQFG